MIQFNLLPDVKMKYIKARRQKRMVMLISAIVGASSLGVVALMLVYIYAVQGAEIATLNSKIKKSSTSIATKNRQVDDINKVLTVQNQLTTLDTLHADKPVTSRIFDYLSKITPAQVTISKLQLANNKDTLMVLEGSTDKLETINQFVDTLKFTTFAAGEGEDKETKEVFTNVVLRSFGRNKDGASYSITMKYDPIIFSGSEAVTSLVVPNQKTTTRSELGRPIIQTETEQQNNAPLPEGQ